MLLVADARNKQTIPETSLILWKELSLWGEYSYSSRCCYRSPLWLLLFGTLLSFRTEDPWRSCDKLFGEKTTSVGHEKSKDCTFQNQAAHSKIIQYIYSIVNKSKKIINLLLICCKLPRAEWYPLGQGCSMFASAVVSFTLFVHAACSVG